MFMDRLTFQGRRFNGSNWTAVGQAEGWVQLNCHLSSCPSWRCPDVIHPMGNARFIQSLFKVYSKFTLILFIHMADYCSLFFRVCGVCGYCDWLAAILHCSQAHCGFPTDPARQWNTGHRGMLSDTRTQTLNPVLRIERFVWGFRHNWTCLRHSAGSDVHTCGILSHPRNTYHSCW